MKSEGEWAVWVRRAGNKTPPTQRMISSGARVARGMGTNTTNSGLPISRAVMVVYRGFGSFVRRAACSTGGLREKATNPGGTVLLEVDEVKPVELEGSLNGASQSNTSGQYRNH